MNGLELFRDKRERMKDVSHPSHVPLVLVTLPIVRYKIDQDFVKPKVAEERERERVCVREL